LRKAPLAARCCAISIKKAPSSKLAPSELGSMVGSVFFMRVFGRHRQTPAEIDTEADAKENHEPGRASRQPPESTG
jgi:hypothetical protein